jgi:NAD(P)-dependent dehydrogenase (short-subunit alcohol dehydrogenase family)
VTAKVALVTGASTGFGKAIALALVGEGCWAFAGVRDGNGRNSQRVAEIHTAAADLHGRGGRLSVVELDVCEDASVDAAVRSVLAQAGRIDVLVNNAGFGVHGPWELTSITDAQVEFDTNFFGAFRVSKAVVPWMREQRSGTVINISSDVAIGVSFLESTYAASKWALEAMSLGMRFELRQFGIAVSVVEPGLYISTEYDRNMRSTIDFENPTGPYADMVRQFTAARNEREVGSRDHEEVARCVCEILKSDRPRFRYAVGCALPRTAQLGIDEYEEFLFEYFDMAAFK